MKAATWLPWGMGVVATVALSVVASSHTPPEPAPPSLDYADPANWVCRPDQPCGDDLTTAVLDSSGAVRLERFEPAASPKIDCFYVYPTVSMSHDQNAPPGVTEAERRAVRQQALRLTAVCRLYVPFYRQLTVGHMEAHLPPDPERLYASEQLVAADIFAAWDHYLLYDNHGRGVVLIGHSQGANALQHLIRSRIENQPARALIVSAVLPGSILIAPNGRDTGGTFETLPACRRDGQVSCVPYG